MVTSSTIVEDVRENGHKTSALNATAPDNPRKRDLRCYDTSSALKWLPHFPKVAFSGGNTSSQTCHAAALPPFETILHEGHECKVGAML